MLSYYYFTYLQNTPKDSCFSLPCQDAEAGLGRWSSVLTYFPFSTFCAGLVSLITWKMASPVPSSAFLPLPSSVLLCVLTSTLHFSHMPMVPYLYCGLHLSSKHQIHISNHVLEIYLAGWPTGTNTSAVPNRPPHVHCPPSSWVP